MKNLLFTIFGVSLMVLMPIVLIHAAYEQPPWYFGPIMMVWIGATTVAAIVWTTKTGFFKELRGEYKVAEPRYRSPQTPRSPRTNEWKAKVLENNIKDK